MESSLNSSNSLLMYTNWYENIEMYSMNIYFFALYVPEVRLGARDTENSSVIKELITYLVGKKENPQTLNIR